MYVGWEDCSIVCCMQLPQVVVYIRQPPCTQALMAQPRDMEELRALVRRLEMGLEGLPGESLQAARFPTERYTAMRDALRLADELVGLRRSLDNHVVTQVGWCIVHDLLMPGACTSFEKGA